MYKTQEIIDGMQFWLQYRIDLTAAGKYTLNCFIDELEESVNKK